MPRRGRIVGPCYAVRWIAWRQVGDTPGTAVPTRRRCCVLPVLLEGRALERGRWSLSTIAMLFPPVFVMAATRVTSPSPSAASTVCFTAHGSKL